MSVIIFDENGEISLGNLHDLLSRLETLKERAEKANSEDENLLIWNELRQIAQLLEEPNVMKLAYAKNIYPVCYDLCKEIREQLKKKLRSPKSWKLFYFEK